MEVLEICREHAISTSSVKTRLALILLDNLAEILMFHRCQELFESEDYVKHVIRPRIPERQRKEAEKDFPGKVRFLSNVEKYISPSDAVILRISHAYRNVAFHRDEHNPTANGAIARMLFDTVCRLFATSYGVGHMEGGKPETLRWLDRYGYSKPYLEYSEASQRITSELVAGMEFSHGTLRTILVADLLERHQRVIAATLRDLPLPELVLDVILKSEEFDESFDVDQASASLREAGYGIAEGNPPSREEYHRLSSEYTQQTRETYDRYRPKTTWRRIFSLDSSIKRLANAVSGNILLARYHQLNEFLSMGERHLYNAIRKNDAAGEAASELARGK